jgi:integrase
MSLSKKGNIYFYDFEKYGQRHRGTTGQTSKKKAREFEEKVKTDLALSRAGLTIKRRCPTLQEFLAPHGKFLTHVAEHTKKPKTARDYRNKAKQLLGWDVWRDLPLSDITGDLMDGYSAYRRINVGEWAVRNDLVVLRKALRLAEEWHLVGRIKVKLPPEPEGRNFIVSTTLEHEYLETTRYPLKHVAVLMLDLGLRPEEAVELRKAAIGDGELTIESGKTKNARRALPLTARVRETIAELQLLFPDSEWLFPSQKGSHYQPQSLDHIHLELRQKMGWPEDFDLYAFRHTFGTQLAESGANPIEIMRLMGHGDLRTSARYIHPSADGLSLAMKRKEAYARTRMELPQGTSDANRAVSKYPQKIGKKSVSD